MILARKYFYVNYCTSLTVGYLKGGILDLASLLTKDSMEQLLLGTQFRFSFRSDLTYEYITGFNLGTNKDYSFFIKVAQAFFADIWYISGNLLWSQLCLPGFNF